MSSRIRSLKDFYAAFCDLIVMGDLGTHTGALLGSVGQGTAEQGGVPMLLVK